MFVWYIILPAVKLLSNHPLMSSPTHQMYIPRREGVCWKSHFDKR